MNLIKFITPTNLAAEKEKFLASPSYDPVFTYAWDSPAAQTWAAKKEKYRYLTSALLEQDMSRIVAVAQELFATKITPDLLTLAQELTKQAPDALPFTPLPEVVDAFAAAFKFLGLPEYSVEIVDTHGFNFRPMPRHKKVAMSRYINLDFFSLDGELKHELVHVIRYENGKYNRISAATQHLPTEEGLAAYCQDYLGQEGHSALFQHAAEYAATKVALRGSLREVIEYFLSIGFSPELAWQRAVRHKFGWQNTAEPGDIMKPSMYFYHEQLIRKLSDDERWRLFVGKISVDQLPQHPLYHGRIPLKKLRYFYGLDK
jgi:hypothetical protein